jgi:hypothetical protein
MSSEKVGQRIDFLVKTLRAIPGYAPPPSPYVLPVWLYDKAEAAGYDMREYVKQEKIPTS